MKNILIGILVSIFIISQGYCGTGWLKTKPAGTPDLAADLDTAIQENNAALDLALSYLRQGCVLSYSSTSALSVGAGSLVVSNSSGAVRLMLAKTSAITTNWNVAENGLDAGSEPSSTTVYVYAIASAVTDTTYTIKLSTNASAPSGVTYYKRLGSFYNDSSSNITQIVNDNDSLAPSYVKGQGNYYKIDSGSVSAAAGDTAISFDFTYAAAPIVVMCYGTGVAGNWAYEPYIKTITTTGATITQPNDGTATIYWIAIGQVLAQ